MYCLETQMKCSHCNKIADLCTSKNILHSYREVKQILEAFILLRLDHLSQIILMQWEETVQQSFT